MANIHSISLLLADHSGNSRPAHQAHEWRSCAHVLGICQHWPTLQPRQKVYRFPFISAVSVTAASYLPLLWVPSVSLASGQPAPSLFPPCERLHTIVLRASERAGGPEGPPINLIIRGVKLWLITAERAHNKCREQGPLKWVGTCPHSAPQHVGGRFIDSQTHNKIELKFVFNAWNVV